MTEEPKSSAIPSFDIILYQAEDGRNRIKLLLENETVEAFVSVRRERRMAA